jgi:DNA-binding Lrp family transcriptional regulator
MNTKQENPRYIEISFDILDIPDMPAGHKLLLGLIEHDCRENDICTRTLKNIAEILRAVPLTVTKGIRKLEQDGYIEIIEGKSEKNRPQYSYKVIKRINE